MASIYLLAAPPPPFCRTVGAAFSRLATNLGESILRTVISFARVARQGLGAVVLLAFAIGSPVIGGAFGCCTAGHDSAAGSHAAPASHADHHTPAPGDQPLPTSPCGCLGACHIVESLIVADTAVDAAVPAATDAVPRLASASTRRVTHIAHALPFAHAPPQTLS